MKKMKKVFALLVAMVMVMGMTVTASATGTGKITISGTGIDGNATVTYGQIIAEDRESTLGWKFVDMNVEKTFVAAWNTVAESDLDADGVIEALIDLGKLKNVNNKNIAAGTINGDAAFGAALAAVVDMAQTPVDKTNGTNVNGGKGLYVIKAVNEGYTFLPMAAYINTAMDDVAVQAKGSKDQIDKTVAETGQSVAPGDEVDYTITEQYLYFAPNSEKVFTITDTLTNGTFKADSVKVILKDTADAETETELVKETDYTITDYANGTTFTVDFGAKYKPAYAGKTVVITYTAIAGEVTTDAPLSNSAHSSNGTGKIVETKPVSFTVIKVDADNNDTPLKDAEFTIYKEAKEGEDKAVELTLEDGSKVWGIPVREKLTTDKNGKVTVNNLDAQETYYVKETKAPKGYSLNDTAYKLTGAEWIEDSVRLEEKDGVTYGVVTHEFEPFDDITVEDTKLSSLPSTGGIGTTIFTIGGCVIMIAAAGLFFASRRKSAK